MKFENFQLMLKLEQSVDQAGKRTRQYNDLEHILCMYTNFSLMLSKQECLIDI